MDVSFLTLSDRFMGSIIASGAVRGSLNLTGNASWLVPVWLQLLCSLIIACTIPFLQESPRWQYVNGKQDQAKAFIAKYHSKGSNDSIWVRLQFKEYAKFLKLNGAVSTYIHISGPAKTKLDRINDGTTIAPYLVHGPRSTVSDATLW